MGGNSVDAYLVVLSKSVEKNLKKVPAHISLKLLTWVDAITNEGLASVRKIPGYHDEPLKGNRTGQRSIRLSKAYRAIYILTDQDEIEIVEVIDLNKHDY